MKAYAIFSLTVLLSMVLVACGENDSDPYAKKKDDNKHWP